MEEAPRLYLFQCGTLTCRVGNLWERCSDPTPIELPVPWFALTHPRGNIVIDGGNAFECIADARRYWGPVGETFHPNMTVADHSTAGLARIGVSPDRVRFVVHSHLHSDHTGALGQFPRAEHIVRRAEYHAALKAKPGDASGYVAREIRNTDIKWRFIADETQHADILGDGSLVAIPTPGHTPGHQSHLLHLKHSGFILLTHDAVYTCKHWALEAPAAASVSATASIRSIQTLKAIANHCNATVIPGHDPSAWQSFTQAPAYYD